MAVRRKQASIIEAGVSGLAAASRFNQKGHTVTLVETSSHLGGVWSPSARYPDVLHAEPERAIPIHRPSHARGLPGVATWIASARLPGRVRAAMHWTRGSGSIRRSARQRLLPRAANRPTLISSSCAQGNSTTRTAWWCCPGKTTTRPVAGLSCTHRSTMTAPWQRAAAWLCWGVPSLRTTLQSMPCAPGRRG